MGVGTGLDSGVGARGLLGSQRACPLGSSEPSRSAFGHLPAGVPNVAKFGRSGAQETQAQGLYWAMRAETGTA